LWGGQRGFGRSERQAGFIKRRKHPKRLTRLGLRDFRLKQHPTRKPVEGFSHGLQARRYIFLQTPRPWLITTGRIHLVRAGHLQKLFETIRRGTTPQNQPAAKPFQIPRKRLQALMQPPPARPTHPPFLGRLVIQNINRNDRPIRSNRRRQRQVVGKPEILAKPKQNRGRRHTGTNLFVDMKIMFRRSYISSPQSVSFPPMTPTKFLRRQRRSPGSCQKINPGSDGAIKISMLQTVQTSRRLKMKPSIIQTVSWMIDGYKTWL